MVPELNDIYLNMTWDTTDTSATIGGSAASKVSSTVSYPDNKTLLINVTQDFSAGDTLIISGLGFDNFTDQSFKDHLELSIDGGATVAATDSKFIWVIHWQTPSIYGACTSCCGAGNVVDGNTATGNCQWGGPVVFDLGESKTVRFMRVWANFDRSWRAKVGEDLTLCGTDWLSARWGWVPANNQWSETPVIPTVGRYLRFEIDAGGPMGADTLMEFQYQAW